MLTSCISYRNNFKDYIWKIVRVTLIISCHINANWPGKVTWHMATLIRIKLLVHTGSTEAGFTLWHTELNDPLLPSLSPQRSGSSFLLNSINFTCPLVIFAASWPSCPLSQAVWHILFSRPARIFCNTYFKPALCSKMPQIKNTELPQQQSACQS